MTSASESMEEVRSDFITSRLRLFLSVDIVGSTAFKQSSSSNSFDDVAQPWLIPIAKFYREFDSNLSTEWRRYVRHELPSGPTPALWKAIGDELVYTKTIESPREVIGTVQVWRNVVHKYRQTFYSNNLPLDLKTTGWLAGFPYTNAEIAFSVDGASVVAPEDLDDASGVDAVYENLKLLSEYYRESSAKKIVLDFIGPSIDTGFRLTGLSSRRKMVVSVDLAYMIACEIEWWRQKNLPDYFGIDFRYDGRQPLKGVMGGKLYPVFWIDNTPHRSFTSLSKDDELDHAEDDLLLDVGVPQDRLLDFTRKFLSHEQAFPRMPYINVEEYINSRRDDAFAIMPEDHKEKIQEIRNYWINETKKRRSVVESVSGRDDREPRKPMVSKEQIKDLVSALSAKTKETN